MPIPIDRREFLKLGLLAASAQLAPQQSWSFTPQALSHAASPKKVLVVGAGLAGLVAGYELTQASHDVTILEAQLRPGGRVQTLREPFSDGLYAEAGAARIPDNHDLTLHDAKQFGLTLVPFFSSKLDMVYLIGGKWIKCRSWSDIDLSKAPLNLTAEERRLGMSGLMQKYLGDALNEIGDPRTAGWPSVSAKKYDSVTMAEFLKEHGASHGAIELLEYPYASAEDDPVSLLWNLRDYWYPLRETTRYKIDGGNDKLPRRLSARHRRVRLLVLFGAPARFQSSRGASLPFTPWISPASAGYDHLRLGAVRRLACEAADCGLLSADLAAGIRRVKGVKKLGVRLGNWLTNRRTRPR